MTPDDVRAVVNAVLEEEIVRRGKMTDEVVMKAVATILTGFGIDEGERLEVKKDFSYLRRFRKSSEAMGNYTMRAVITVVVSGVLAALWLGIQIKLGKNG